MSTFTPPLLVRRKIEDNTIFFAMKSSISVQSERSLYTIDEESMQLLRDQENCAIYTT
jgi:hypothetical protein